MPDVTNEGSPHPLSVAKSNFVCDDLNRQPPLFQHQPRRFNAKVLDGLGWRLRSFFVKRATRLTWTEPRKLSKRLNGKVLLQVKAGVGEGFLDAVGLRFQVEKGRKLRLPTSAPWSRSTIAKARSIAAVIPADVQTEPSTVCWRQRSNSSCSIRLQSGCGQRHHHLQSAWWRPDGLPSVSPMAGGGFQHRMVPPRRPQNAGPPTA